MSPRALRPVRVVCALVALAAMARVASASNRLDPPPDASRHPQLSGVWYFAYVHEHVHADVDAAPSVSRFEIQRGYITYRTRINERISARITSDISVDQEGDGAGDIELRLKYGYLQFAARRIGPLHRARFRVGVLPTPWLEFEQRVNDFRVQGPMFLNRARVFISSDFGVSASADLGRQIDATYHETVNRRDAGRWGSIAIGIFNGGGYNEIEQNENSVIQGRLTIRPLPDLLPGLQASFGAGNGKGNTSAAPDYDAVAVMISHESSRTVVTLTGYDGVGDLRGNVVDEDGKAVPQRGFSTFGEAAIHRDVSLIGRYDLLRTEFDDGDRDLETWIAGVAWRCLPGGQFLLSYENVKELGAPTEERLERIIGTLEARF